MFAAIWRWFFGSDNRRQTVKLSDIPTWTELFRDNGREFVDAGQGEDDTRYEEDQNINDKLSIYEGDITRLEVDGIVRSTDITLTSQEGISGSISKAAGSQLTRELRTLQGCKPGEVKITAGYDLSARYILHTVGPQQEEDASGVLERCYRTCLEQMLARQTKSLAFCCISTGIRGYPQDKAVLVALKTVRLWLEDLKIKQKLDEIDRIVFCLYSEMDVLLYSIWMQVFFPCSLEPHPTPANGPTYQPEIIFSRGTEGTETINVPSTSSRRRSRKLKSPVIDQPDVNYSRETEERETGNVPSTSSLETSMRIEEKERTLQPLPGFVEITSEPDMITLDDNPNARRARMPCGHVIGPQSMTEYCQRVIADGKFKFYCPGTDCNREWDYILVRHVACLSDEEMLHIEKSIERNYLQKVNGTQQCPRCQTWCSRVPKTGNCVRCPICTATGGRKFDFCWICLREWKHIWSCGNPGCDGVDRRIKILATCPTKKINYCDNCPTMRGCPKCGILIEHKSKCGHVECNNCGEGYGFCFICLKERVNGTWQCKPYFNRCVLAPRQTSLPGTR